MIAMFLFCTLIAQFSLSSPVDPASGYSTVLAFNNPETVTTEYGSYTVFENAGLRGVPGEPVRSAVTLLIPVPPGSAPLLQFNASGYRSTGMEGEQARTPVLVGEGLETREIPAEPRSAVDTHVVLEGVIPIAGTQMAQISVYPISGEDASTYASRIDLRISWQSISGGIPVERNRLLRLIAPTGSYYWPDRNVVSVDDIFWGRPWARISIEETGGYIFSGSDLQNAGCEAVGSPCSSLRLFTGPGRMFSLEPDEEHNLSEVAFKVIDQNSDGVFDPEDTIEFIGRGLSRWELAGEELARLQHRYATHNVYWLTWGGEDGLRMGGIPGNPDSSPEWGESIRSDIWLREEHIWNPAKETHTGWVWETTTEGGSITVPFQVESHGSGSSVEVALVMDSSQLHEVALYLDGTEILTESWYGSGERLLLVEDLLLSGSCSLEIRFIDDAGDGTMGLASVHVEYPALPGTVSGTQLFPSREKRGRYNFRVGDVSSGCRVFDISSFDAPLLLSGTEYSTGQLDYFFEVDSSSVFILMDSGDWLSPDSIRSADPGRLVGTVKDGDRLFIVHPSLYDGVWGMVTLSSGDGNNPVVALTSEIYDEFGQGVADPGAIRSAVRWGIDSWSSGLAGVILTGDGHYDFLGFTTTQPVMIPPWIVLGTSQVNCADDIYVMVHENSVLPEIPIARVPVDNLSELGTCTAKLLGYLSGQNRGTWMNRALLAADDEWGQGSSQNDIAHTNDTERIAEEVLPRHIDREKFYLIEYPWPPGSWPPEGPHPDKPEGRESFIETFNQGFAFIIYMGHGSAGQIAHEKMMLSEDIDRLTNGSRLPVSFWSTCNVGEFYNPGTDAIGEAVVTHPAGGCISSVAATRGTHGNNNYSYFRSIVDSLTNNPGLYVGDAVWQSKLAMSGIYHSNNKFYIMFGYPEMPLPLPEADGSVSVNGDTLRSGEFNSIAGSGFQQDGLAFLEILESSWYTTYTCLGGSVIEYLKYGGTAFRGTETVSNGEFEHNCFIPLQSTTGDLARIAATVLSGETDLCGAQDPTVLIEGFPSGNDLEGPSVTMWLRGYDGVEHPEVTGDITLEAEISDSSGICLLGGSGRQLSLFVDGNGSDVSAWFSYNRGSSTDGRLTYEIEALSPGEHSIILWSIDGVGNSSRDTLNLRILEDQDLSITEALVYPNPGYGQRCFSFRVSEDSEISISIFTVSGTKIEELSTTCAQGYNQILWNGFDHDGDSIASGSYIYRIEANALGSSVFSRTAAVTGILAVTKED
ncbi:MAG: hypothetical protein K8R76_09575 [Candidatus Aegiribacteria sp.]|nr:hypothetical protein [Candidatus Aegiribacteria sp.]